MKYVAIAALVLFLAFGFSLDILFQRVVRFLSKKGPSA